MKNTSLVMVADDDRQVRDALEIRLAQAGFDVVTAEDAHSAIEVFDRRKPDAALLDVKMPGSDGFAVCEHIRSTGSPIPVFFLTGTSDGIVRGHLAKLTHTVGANHFLTKPYDSKALALMLREALDRAAGNESAEQPSDSVAPLV